MLSIYDATFNGMGGSEFYRSLSFPELFPGQKPMLLNNWPIQDLEEYCGGVYTPGYNKEEAA